MHNIPEGLAVGVSFGAIGNTESATFESARYGIELVLSMASFHRCSSLHS